MQTVTVEKDLKCPKCGSKLLTEKDCRPHIEDIGDFFTYGTSRHFDEWSLIDFMCSKPSCNYRK